MRSSVVQENENKVSENGVEYFWSNNSLKKLKTKYRKLLRINYTSSLCLCIYIYIRLPEAGDRSSILTINLTAHFPAFPYTPH